MSDALRRAHELLRRYEESGGKGYPRAREGAVRGAQPAERARLARWASSLVRHRYTLRALLGAVARRLLKKARPELSAALLLGAWRLLDEDIDAAQRPALIAELSKLAGGRKGADKVARGLEALGAVIAERRPAGESEDAARIDRGEALPLPGGRIVIFEGPTLPVEGRSPAARLALIHSLPEALAESWLEAYGEVAWEVARLSNEPAPLFARANRLKTTPAELAAALEAQGIGARIVGEALPDALELTEARARFRRSPEFHAGAYSIQDLTAQRVPLALAPAPGASVLDLCAAPGGKSGYLAELMGDEGRVVALDRKPARLRKVEDLKARLGLSCIEAIAADGRDPDALGGERFDALLIDAPCSNTGVLRRRPEARWRYDASAQRRHIRDQRALLEAGWRHLRPGGRCAWSVCSIEPGEGPEIVAWWLSVARDARLIEERRGLPEVGGGDGGYHAVLLKEG